MSAWQHPQDRCTDCGQDILLGPQITSDARLIHVRYCPACDAGEPIVEPPVRRRTFAAAGVDAEEFWARTERRERATSAAPPANVTASAHRAPPAAAASAAREDIDLWWDGEADGGRHRAEMSLDARWARFVGDDEDGDDMPLAAEGSFSFGVEDGPRRRRSLFRLRQSA